VHIENRWLRCCAGWFYGLQSFLRMETILQPSTAPGMIMGLGFMFFVLLSISSFTANLTTFLMMRRFKTGVESITDAINFNYKICAYKELGDEIAMMTPGLRKQLVFAGLGGCPALLYAGEADAAIMAESELKLAYAGELVKRDCMGIEPGSTKFCPGSGGELDTRRDCEIKLIDEDPLLMLAVSMPTRHDIQHKVGWSADDLKVNLAAAQKKYKEQFPQEIDDCRPPEIEAITEPMNILSLQGSTVASMIFVMVGWGLMAAGKLRTWWLLRKLAKEKGRELTEEEIQAFKVEERRKALAAGDQTDNCTGTVEDCERLVKSAMEGRDDKMGALDKNLTEMLVKIQAVSGPVSGGAGEVPATPASPPPVPDETQLGLTPSSTQNGNPAPGLAEAYGTVEKELKQEQMLTEKLWREVAAERARLKQEWADYESARRNHSAKVQVEHAARVEKICAGAKATPATLIPLEVASPRDDPEAIAAKNAKKALRDKWQELQEKMNQQMEEKWADVHSQRAAHREELKKLRTLQAETSAMWKEVSKAQEETSQLRVLVPFDSADYSPSSPRAIAGSGQIAGR